MKIKRGDIVGRISYGKDILFVVKKIIRLKDGKKIAILKGLTERIEASSYIEDLCIIEKEIIEASLKSLEFNLEKRATEIKSTNKILNTDNKRSRKEIRLGKILHLDGDKRYSEKSTMYYKKLNLNAIVKNISESKQPQVVYSLLQYYKPDILVITRT